VRDSHCLIPLDVELSDATQPIGEVLNAIALGGADLSVDSNDDPSWTDAVASPEREYWIAGARDELQSLEQLKVFALVPRSDLPRGQ